MQQDQPFRDQLSCLRCDLMQPEIQPQDNAERECQLEAERKALAEFLLEIYQYTKGQVSTLDREGTCLRIQDEES